MTMMALLNTDRKLRCYYLGKKFIAIYEQVSLSAISYQVLPAKPQDMNETGIWQSIGSAVTAESRLSKSQRI